MQSKVILELTKKLENHFGPKASKNLEINLKDDKSIVTEIDLFVSNLIKEQLQIHPIYQAYDFFSEEEFDELHFPSAILDPIDGTRELALGRAECAVSLALMKTSRLDDPSNYGWICNPFTGFSLDSADHYVNVDNKSIKKILGMVSRSEFEKGYFDKYLSLHPKIDISPRGSIAFKLGLLAAGACDFVLSVSPKNIWDIAGGSILCEQRGIHLYQNGNRVTDLNQIKINGILLWAQDSLAAELWGYFKNEK